MKDSAVAATISDAGEREQLHAQILALVARYAEVAHAPNLRFPLLGGYTVLPK